MKNRTYILAILILTISTIAMTQSGGDFTIKKSTTDAGGGKSTGGDFALVGTIGQADASDSVSGGDFSLSGGFWSAPPIIREELLFKNGFED